jgi:bifunctional UDP-N-acetylglucosamine pyrophosphorylase/glucosamine-1-phosphate N-acetyltransferase
VLVLAAGKGTRMHSARPKVLQQLLEEPMASYVVRALAPVLGEDVWMLVGHCADDVRKCFPGGRFVFQERQLGTAHALGTALPDMEAAGIRRVLLVNGDTPLLTPALVASFLERTKGAPLAFATITLDDPGAYGRVIREGGRGDGRVRSIVEAKEFDVALHGPEGREVNAGMYAVDLALAKELLPLVTCDNAGGEYYVTDLVELAVGRGIEVLGIACGADTGLLGVNTPGELARSEELLREARVEALLESGVVIHAPSLVRVGPLAEVAPGARLTGPCEIYGASRIASEAECLSHVVVRNCTVERGAVIRSFSHIEDAVVGEGAIVGPFARLRPGARLEAGSHVGNFVELKNAVLGPGAKANHLTYLGDASIGAGANIGAGTITCNYDGKHKYRTTIGERAFIGSNTAMVAPVVVGDDALVGAGSVVTRNVGPGEMAIARGRQRNIPRRLAGRDAVPPEEPKSGS